MLNTALSMVPVNPDTGSETLTPAAVSSGIATGPPVKAKCIGVVRPIRMENWNTAGRGLLPALPVKFTVTVNGSVAPHGVAESTKNANELPTAEFSPGIVG